ncbi:MAG TPA: EF-hand domain-containing protein [Sphingomicrobium sp.]|nr:EF-hand domain-containing protein [Sphingomicrobium sp.]
MKKLLAGIALGAAIISTSAIAQEGGGPMQQDMTRAQAQQRADQMFQRFDVNHTGTITRAQAEQMAAQFGGRGERMVDRLFGTAQSLTLQQFEAQQLARFDAMDLNHDGTVTAAEREQARQQMRAQRGDNAPQ